MANRKQKEQLGKSVGDISLDVPGTDGRNWTDDIAERANRFGRLHPSAEEMMAREAAKQLTKSQMLVWEMWNYDRMTQDEIAETLHISQQAVSQRIATIEKRIVNWCRSNMATYELLKGGKENP